MGPITIQAYAKVNLTLDVFNQRSDGYHSLASVIQSISLHDTLHLARIESPEIDLVCEGEHAAGVPTDSSNLVVRAARMLLDAADQTDGLAIRLDKQVPSQAGLGGGSSDAAATLLGVAALFGLDVGPKLLHELAAGLGSDVPFFLCGGTAVMRGRGESISPIADAPRLYLVVVKPEECVSTAWAYDALDADPDRSSNRATRHLQEAIERGDVRRTIADQSNDFEGPVFSHYPRLAWLRDELLMAGARSAHLCGSGSAVYGVAEDETTQRMIAARMRKSYPYVYATRTLSRVEANPLRGLPA